MATCKGKGHPDTIKMLNASKKPQKHEMYGESFKWRTSANDMPKGLSGEELEKWLWLHAVVEEKDVEAVQRRVSS